MHPINAARRTLLPALPREPVVLAHGAWMGAASWSRFADELRGRGHAVTAVDLPGHGITRMVISADAITGAAR